MLYQGDVDFIDPGQTYYSGGYFITEATQRRLVNYRPQDPQHAVPDLANAPPRVSADGRTVTVQLRAGVRFSPPVGRSITSKDVRYAIERGFFRTVNNGYAATYFGDLLGARVGAKPGAQIRGIETPDTQTIVFKLSRGTGGALAGALALPLSAPVPEEYAARYDRHNPSDYGEHQVATGPYMIANNAEGTATGYRPGRRIHLVRNPRWDAGTDYRPAYLDEIEVEEGNTETTVAAQRILNGRAMISGDFPVPGPVLKQVVKRRRDQLALVPVGGLDYMPLNTAIAPFNDINVRRAVVAGVNRNAIRLVAGGAIRGPLATHFIPPGIPGFTEAGGLKGPGYDFLARPDGDRQVAARYFRKAGFRSGRYEGKEPVLVMAMNDPGNQRAGEIVQNSLSQMGFDVRLRFVTSNAFYTKFCLVPAAKVNVCVGWTWFRDFPDGQTILAPTFNGKTIQPQSNVNASQLNVSAINAAIARAELVTDASDRARAWADVDRQVTAQAPAILGTWLNQPIVRSKDVAGVANPNIVGWDIAYTSLR